MATTYLIHRRLSGVEDEEIPGGKCFCGKWNPGSLATSRP